MIKRLMLVLALATGPSMRIQAQAGCGIVPIKPIPPIGCRDMVAVCMCDSTGQNCAWTWRCVR